MQKLGLACLLVVACGPPIVIDPPKEDGPDEMQPPVIITSPTGPTGMPPLATLTPIPDALTNLTSYSITVAGDRVARYTFALDGAAPSPATAVATPIKATLGDGTHTLSVFGIDAAGTAQTAATEATWIIDTTPPDSTTAVGVPGVTMRGDTFSIVAGGAGATAFSYTIDCVGYADSGTLPIVTPLTNGAMPVAEGQCALALHAIDAAGNEDLVGFTASWIVDTTPPITTLTGVPPSLTNNTNLNITVGDGTAYRYSLDCADPFIDVNDAIVANGAQHITATLTDGACSLMVFARDQAGNEAPTGANASWTVESTLVDTVLTGLPAATTNQQLDITVSSNPFGEGTAYRFSLLCDDRSIIDRDVPSINTHIDSALIDGDLTDGDCVLTVLARNAVGAEDPDASGSTFSFIFDSTEPTTSLTSLPSAFAATGTIDITVSGDGNRYAYSLDCADPFTDISDQMVSLATHIKLDAIPDGDCDLSVAVIDAAGNRDSTPAVHSWRVDTSPPNTLPLASLGLVISAFDLSVQGTTGTTGYVYSLDCVGQTDIVRSITTPLQSATLSATPSEGTCHLSVAVFDEAGNRDPTPETASFEWNAIFPNTTLGSLPAPTGNSAAYSISVIADQGAVGYTVRLECSAGVIANYVSVTSFANIDSTTYGAAPDGACELSVAGVDQYGSADPSPATYHWFVDTMPPESTLSGVPGSTGQNTTFNISVFAPGGVSYRYVLDCAGTNNDITAVASISTPITQVSPALDGTCSLDVYARDFAGNEETTPSHADWVVTTAAPIATLSPAPTGRTNVTTYEFIVGGDGVVDFFYSQDGSNNGPIPVASHINATLTDGPHTFSVRGRNGVGNTQSVPTQVSWTIDATGPAVTLVNAPPASVDTATVPPITVTTVASDAINYSYVLTGPTGRSVTNTPFFNDIMLSDLIDGVYTLTVTARDDLGNIGAPTIASFIIDSTPPVGGCINDGSPIAASDDVVIQYDEPPGAYAITGITDAYTTSFDGMTNQLTLHATTGWTPQLGLNIDIRAYSGASGSTGSLLIGCSYDVLGSATELYVDVNAAPGIESGTIAQPYHSIEAATLSGPTTPAIIRVAAGTYAERVQILPGQLIYGGYSSDFATRTSQTSLIAPAGIEAVACVSSAPSTPSVMDGFRISTPAAAGAVTAVNADGCYGAIRHNRIDSASPADEWFGMIVRDSTVEVRSNRFDLTPAAATFSHGLVLDGSTSQRITFNTFSSNTTATMVLESTQTAAHVIAHNTFTALNTASTLMLLSSGAEVVENDITAIGDPAVLIDGGGSHVIGNTITVTSGGVTRALANALNPSSNVIRMSGTGNCLPLSLSTGVIQDNIITNTCTTSRGIELTTGYPVSMVSGNRVTSGTLALNASNYDPGAPITIQGNTFISPNSSGLAFRFTMASGAAVTADVHILDNFFTAETGAAVFTSQASVTHVCDGNDRMLIARNRFKTNSDEGLVLSSNGCVKVHNNIFLTLGPSLTLQTSGAGTNTSLVEHNTFIAGSRAILHSATAQAFIYNNIIQGDGMANAIGVEALAAPASMTANVFWNWAGSDYARTGDCGDDTCSGPETNALAFAALNLHERPYVINPYGNNFHIYDVNPGEPGFADNCGTRYGGIDRTATVPQDYDSVDRTLGISTECAGIAAGSGITMGAYENDL